MEKSITAPDYAVFLRELRAARKAAGLNQTGLALRIGETQSFVRNCERGERRLDVIELRMFCLAFGSTLPIFVKRLEAALADDRTKDGSVARR